MSTLFNKRTVLNLIDRFMIIAYYGSFFLVLHDYLNEYVFYFFPVLLFLTKRYIGFKTRHEKLSFFLYSTSSYCFNIHRYRWYITNITQLEIVKFTS